MEISDIKFNIEKILDDNKAQNITSIDLKKKSYKLIEKSQAKVNPQAHGQNRSIKPIGFFNLIKSIKIFTWFIKFTCK